MATQSRKILLSCCVFIFMAILCGALRIHSGHSEVYDNCANMCNMHTANVRKTSQPIKSIDQQKNLTIIIDKEKSRKDIKTLSHNSESPTTVFHRYAHVVHSDYNNIHHAYNSITM